MRIVTLPFPALVGLDAARQALLLLAVEPRLGGVVLAAPAGSGKSSLARGFHALIGDASAPFAELPLGADEESLLGGLDIQATLRAGTRVARTGLLARAHGGVLYVDGLNLLADSNVNLLLAALESGEVRLEREGLSMRAPASFRLIGSYDPAEGLPRKHLIERVGLLVVLPPVADTEQRAEVVRRNLGVGSWQSEGRIFSPSSQLPTPNSQWNHELDLLRGLVIAAREQLPAVKIADEQIQQLAAAAVAFGVEGQRADLFAVRAAAAAAALDLRDTVEQADLELAMRLVILPRATRVPASDEQSTDDRQPSTADDQPPTSHNEQPQPGRREPRNQEPRTQDQELEPQPENEEADHQSSAPNSQPLAEQVLTALAADLPHDLANLPFRTLRRGRSGSRGSTSASRGRHIRSMAGDPRRARIDIAATLRAAAPWQPLRLQTADCRLQISNDTICEQSEICNLKSAIALRADDLRVKRFRTKAGALFLFAVDASGSMALHRMRQAKGAVHTLLQQAYIHRDQVALTAFRGQSAMLLLPPSQSVELARRALDLLPTGGGTPMAAALLQAIEIAKRARGRGIFQTILVLLTDGRANVGLSEHPSSIQAELQLLGRQIALAGIQSLVVDTQRSYLSRGEAHRLADWLAGTYIYLPNANGAQIAAQAAAAIEARRE